MCCWPCRSCRSLDASFRRDDFGVLLPGFTLENYRLILGSGEYFELFYKTGGAALAVTFFCAVLGFPIALLISGSPPRSKAFLYLMVTAPLLINTVVRSYGWLLMLGNRGVINSTLMSLGITQEPIPLTGDVAGMVIGATQVCLPFMILSRTMPAFSSARAIVQAPNSRRLRPREALLLAQRRLQLRQPQSRLAPRACDAKSIVEIFINKVRSSEWHCVRRDKSVY